MFIKEFVSKDTGGKNRIFVEVECDVCTSIFVRQKRQLKQHVCSRMCGSILKGSAVELDCAHCGSTFVRALSKLNNSKSGKYFCCRECKDIAQSYMIEIQPEHYGTGESSYREKAFRAYRPICCRCGFANIAALEVHHIDRDRSNNNISNLEILCANCHKVEHLGN